MVIPQDIAVIGAYMMNGLRDVGQSDEPIVTAFGAGHIEMVIGLTSVAPYMYDLMTEWVESGADFPGVFDYDVSENYGAWWGATVIDHIPTEEECRAKCKELVDAFFTTGIQENK